MSIADKVERMRTELDGLVREQADRQALQERHSAEIKAKAEESMKKQVQAAERYVQHRRELGRREKEARGWATEKTLSERSDVMAFGPEEEDPAATATGYAQFESSNPSATGSAPAPALWQEPAPAASPAPGPQAAQPAARRRGRHARDDSGFDDDDFSNNSWIVD
jgi:hypothetical protein